MTTQQIHGALEVFAEQRRSLLGLLRRHRAVAGLLGSSALTDAVAALEERVAGATFLVLVLGGPDRGSAVLAEAMLGRRWLGGGGVDITDSPGLGEQAIRALIADGSLARADAIIFVAAGATPFSEGERRYLQNFVLPLAHEDIFFVSGHRGGPSAAQGACVEALLYQQVSRLHIGGLGQPGGTLWDPRVFAADEAGLPWFEEALQRFLAREKGRVKLLSPVREMRARLRQTQALLRDHANMRQQDPTMLAGRYEDLRPELDLLDQRGKAIAAGLEDDIQSVEVMVEEMTCHFLTALCALDPGRREEMLLSWQNDILDPRLRLRLTAIEKALNIDIGHFLAGVARLRAAVTGALAVRPDPACGSALDELLSGGDQPVDADRMIDVAGARAGADAVLGAVLPHVGVLIAGLLPSLAGPVDLAAAGLARGFARQVGAELRAFSARVERDLGGQTRTVREIAQAGAEAAGGWPAAARGEDPLGALAAQIERLEHARDELEDQISAL
jgi:hypothetical protein